MNLAEASFNKKPVHFLQMQKQVSFFVERVSDPKGYQLLLLKC